jgi:hypothetical protein
MAPLESMRSRYGTSTICAVFLLVVFAGGFKVGKLVISSVGDEVIVHNVLTVPMNIMLISIYSAV